MMDVGRIAAVGRGLRMLLRIDTGYVDHFERSYDGFIRSFLPALILAPLYFTHISLIYDDMDPRPDAAVYAVTEVIGYVLTWTLFPFVMVYVTRLLNRASRYFSYMVPYNWFQLLLGLIVFPLTIATDLQVIGGDGAAFLNTLVFAGLLMYATFLARTGLAIATASAFGLVVLDIVLNLLGGQIIERIQSPG